MRRTFLGTSRPAVCGYLLLAALTWSMNSGSGEPPQPPTKHGRNAEKRFPPLLLPAGFKATLFACDPLIEYPSAIALGPHPRSLFVAIDYLTGLGTGLDRRDEIRLIESTDGDGYADKVTVFATGLNSIQGMVYHDGTLYVMHAPYLTALRDTRGTGKADERRDLLTGLGLPPEKDPIRLHNANGVVAAHDGFLYLALGDHGCDVQRPEGDRLVLQGGGILRCRPTGRDLHVFSTGLRNIYDVALDEELNVFVRDNENDGGDYKIRVCHSFFGADHGYPYLYHEQPDEALAPLADLGLGSSAGGVCYLERQFPAEHRGNLFFCEWGRAVVRYPLTRSGATFATPKEADFAAGAPTDPYGFKPTDLVVAPDGTLFVSDWADGQRPRRGRGRIYQIRYTGPGARPGSTREKEPARLEEWVQRLDSESHSQRCVAQEAIERHGKEGVAAVALALNKGRLGARGRLHAVWVLARVEGAAAVERLLRLVKGDPDPRVQAQALRAVADLSDPVLVRHRLGAGAGDGAFAERLASLAAGRDARVQLEGIIALGRLRWTGAPAWLGKNLKTPDPALAHAARWALRRSGNWPAVLKLLDEPSSEPFRAIARRAVAGQFDLPLVDGLIHRLKKESDAKRRHELADALARVCKKPAPWTYWGFRPPPRPANSVPWARTEAIEAALDHALADPDRAWRLATLRRMLREKVPARLDRLGRWLEEEREAETVAVLLAALRDRPAGETRPHLEAILRDHRQTSTNRLAATALFLHGLGADPGGRLTTVAGAVEDGPVLAELLRAAGTRKAGASSKLLLAKLSSPDAEVRASAVTAVADVGLAGAQDQVRKLLGDPAARVRSAAALAAGRLTIRPAADRLLKLAADADASVRRASLEALRLLREPRGLPLAVAALADQETAAGALACVGDLGGPEHAGVVADQASRHPSAEVLAAAGKALTGWAAREALSEAQRHRVEQALADIHGSTGVLLGWHVLGPLSGDGGPLVTRAAAGKEPLAGARLVLSAGTDARVRLVPAKGQTGGAWLASSAVAVPERTPIELFTAASAPATIWLNGKVIYRRDRPGASGRDPVRFEAILVPGTNRVLVRLAGVQGAGEFQLRFRRKSATAMHERLTRAALSRAGNPERGRRVFHDADRSLCVKCHRVGDKGERVGPDLTGLGSRFSKAYIIESILEPGRTVSPSFASTSVTLKTGKILIGIKVAETESSITLVDSEAKKHVLARSAIEEMTKHLGSTMPDGLEKRLTEEELVDLVAYLASLKEMRR
jgi:putative membrane-bound dehydrogenase-like protein